MNPSKTFGLTAALAAFAVSGAWAQTKQVTITAAPANFPGDSFGATAQVGLNGPGDSQDYMDVQAPGNGSYASFGVIDFTGNYVYGANGHADTVTGVAPTLTLDLTDEAYQYTVPGNLNFYLADGNAPLSSLKYDPTDTSATAGMSSQLGDLFSLGRGVYTSTSKTVPGGTDQFSLILSPLAQSYFVKELNSGGNLRLAIAADPSTPFGVASFAGATNGDGAPSLTFTANAAPVPEASTTVGFGLMLALGLGGLAAARRRRAAPKE